MNCSGCFRTMKTDSTGTKMHEPGEYLGRHKKPKGRNTIIFKVLFCFFNWQQPSSLWAKTSLACYWLPVTPPAMCMYLVNICQYLSSFKQYVHVSVSMCMYLVSICQFVSVFESMYMYLFVCACILSVFISVCLYLSSMFMYLYF
jgi:hypothetical protein